MNRRIPARGVEFRTHGPAVTAAGDGLEGSYAATLFSVPSGGKCKVIVPDLDPVTWRTANCSPAFTGSIGDAILATFDHDKQPWVVSPTSVLLAGSSWVVVSSFSNGWSGGTNGTINPAVSYRKDPLGWVHIRGFMSGGTASATAWTLPAGYRPGQQYFAPAVIGGGATLAYVGVDTSGNVNATTPGGSTTSGVHINVPPFLAEN